MRHGFMYLATIIDVFSRRIKSWRLSNTMEAEWCTESITTSAFTTLKGHTRVLITRLLMKFTRKCREQ
ncbi:MAG: hypothetical protein II899_12080 [Bacteroidales bacterium]|nr:hypothetical protein [Bacteroidales bacterium]